MAEAMYSPKGDYRQAKTAEEVAELKKQGYLHGHEYFSMLVNPPKAEPEPPKPVEEQSFKRGKKFQKAKE